MYTDLLLCSYLISTGRLHRIYSPFIRDWAILFLQGSHSSWHFLFSTYWVLFFIGISNSEMKALLAVFPEQCLKATPDPEFLSNLYGFDMSLCPHVKFSTSLTPPITQVFTEKFDAINSSSRVPELFVWMMSQVCPTIIMIVLPVLILNDFYFTFVETPWSEQ